MAAALAVSAVYLAAMRLSSTLAAPGTPIHVLWPPNALLMAALLVSPKRWWPVYLAVLLPAHVAFQVHNGAPIVLSLGWFVGNTGEALIGAALLRSRGRERPLFSTVPGVVRFVLFGVLLAPTVTSFWDAGIVRLYGLGSDYWRLFDIRLFSNAIAILLFVPPFVMAFDGGIRRLRLASRSRWIEAGLLAATGLVVCLTLDWGKLPPTPIPFEVYAPLPIYLWAALRFGPWESSLTVLSVTLVEIWTQAHGGGPFSVSAADGVLFLQANAALIAIPLLLFAVTMDERRCAERKLRRDEERLELAFAVSRLAYWEWDLRTGETVFSLGQGGFQPVVLDPTLPFMLGIVHPEDRTEVRWLHDEAVRTRGSYEAEFRVFDENGAVHWVARRGQVGTDSDGRPVRVFGVSRDITERKKSEEALAAAQKLASLARSAGRVATWSLDAETGEISAESGLPSLLGFDLASCPNSAEFWLSRIYEPDRNALLAMKTQLLGPSAAMDDRGETAIPELEYRIRHADGSLRWFLTRGTVLRNSDGTLRRIVGTAIDVTERKRAELEAQEQRRELTHLARVAALGELSGALAHELNQPLTSILSNAEAARLLIEREPPDLRELGHILDDVIAEDRRAGGVIRHLRSLLGKGPPDAESVDVPSLIQEILTVFNGDLVTRNITLQTSLPSGLPPVHANPVQLQQVLLNLILNACDAMHGGASHERILTISASRKDSSIVISVADRGPGIPSDHMESIFRPFFTTKRDGLGLGLAISQSIASAAGGRLWAENNPDRGATFRFELPLAGASQRRS